MISFKIRSITDDFEFVKGFVAESLDEEKRKLRYAYKKTAKIIKQFEKKFKIKSNDFIKKLKKGEIEETEETFDWFAECKAAKEIERKLKAISSIEICRG
ncbi:MAG: hypothetical protein AB1765_05275 [Candidatus Hydrogenedentota bacterium]